MAYPSESQTKDKLTRITMHRAFLKNPKMVILLALVITMVALSVIYFTMPQSFPSLNKISKTKIRFTTLQASSKTDRKHASDAQAFKTRLQNIKNSLTPNAPYLSAPNLKSVTQTLNGQSRPSLNE